MNFFYDVKYPYREEYQIVQQSPMETVTLILRLEATTVNNPSDISAVTAGAIAGVTAGVTAATSEQKRIDGGLITER